MKYERGIIQILTAVIGLSWGCTGEKLLDGPVPDGPESPVEVRFFTSAVPTRTEPASTGTDTLLTGANVRLYVYRQKTGVKDTIALKDYTVNTETSKVQSLTPAKVGDTAGSEMILPSGIFGFYAVSTNSTTEPVPEFHTGNAEDGVPSATSGTVTVRNGVDYLYAANKDHKIAFGTETADVSLNFRHVGTQVQLTIKFGSGAHAGTAEAAKDFSLATVSIQPTSETNATMRLYDGQILFDGNTTGGSPTEVGNDDTKLKAMTVVRSGEASGTTPADQVATYHMLPLAKSTSQKMKVKVVIENLQVGDKTGTHTYTGSLDASAGWLAGTSNRYTLTLSGTEIKFSTVTVVPWESGTGGEVGDITHTDNLTPSGESGSESNN
ncbi:fimbrillin family protein [uncultured Parabacteroides sp.]|uniref:fimbrillin family protein n=1 Tax=uncultured Parabacteroides sp. TaxID=512312 RepID=UPI0025E8F702|nr:fimbrillin family protein [uncultured Parabacteroides sp.]